MPHAPEIQWHLSARKVRTLDIQPPKNILLATDLGSHSDRALDRAAQLALQWNATLHIVHAQQPETSNIWWPAADNDFTAADDDTEAIREQIRCDLRDPVENLQIHVAEGLPVNNILETAARENCDLIVLGTRGPAFAGDIFRTTATRILRRSRYSVLVVKTRPSGAYSQLLVGTDFTAESRHGLETAATWFADADFALLHALDIPYKSLLLDAGRSAELTRMENEAMQSFVAQASLPETIRWRLQTHIEHGYPEAVLHQHGSTSGAMLTVIGAVRRGLTFQVLIGGNAARIVQNVPGDVLMVRADRD